MSAIVPAEYEKSSVGNTESSIVYKRSGGALRFSRSGILPDKSRNFQDDAQHSKPKLKAS